MSLETQILDVLAATSAVTAVVGNRLRLEWPDQNDSRATLCITRVGGGRDSALDASNYIEDALLQVDCFAATHAELRTLTTAVKTALHGYVGTGTFTIISTLLRNETDLSEHDGDWQRRRTALDFSISHY